MLNQAVILAGGKGLRLLPLTKNTPKPMIQVNGHPFLYWQLRYLRQQGITQVLLLLSHLAHVVQEHFEQEPVPGLTLSYCIEQAPLGTGGALRLALPQLDKMFWLLNGDSFLPLDLAPTFATFQPQTWDAAITAVKTEVEGIGNLRIQGTEVLHYQRDAGLAYVDAGVYLLKRQVIENGPGGSFDLGALWPKVIEQRRLGAFITRQRFFDIGTPERLQIFARHVAGGFKER